RDQATPPVWRCRAPDLKEKRTVFRGGMSGGLKVELEVGQIWDMKGRVKVFGRSQLLRLDEALSRWFATGAR
ncbi:MAG: hypothetical protein ABSH28_23300, partial [Acidobacteriota bacterium]